MRSLFAHARATKQAYPTYIKSVKLKSLSDTRMAYPPDLKVHKPLISRANYFWAANYQTVQIFSALLACSEKNIHPDVSQKITAAMAELLENIIERNAEIGTDPAVYKELVKSHFHGLNAKELNHLAHILKKSKINYDCYQIIFETFERDGRKKEREKIIKLQSTDELLTMLEGLAKTYELSNSDKSEQIFPENWNESVKKIMSDSAAAWCTGKEGDDVAIILLKVAQKIATCLGLSYLPESIEYRNTNFLHSTVSWNGASLHFDARLEHVIVHKNKNSKPTYLTPFERALRDVLELILIKKIFGQDAELANLTSSQLHKLREKIDVVINHTSPASSEDLRTLARDVMKKSASFGHIYISPNGSGSGHTWIAPDFSIFPNNEVDLEIRDESVFMQDAAQFSPAPKKITERSVQFISNEKNEKYFPVKDALVIKIPVPADVLQLAAQKVKDRWMKEAIPYRAVSGFDSGDVHSCRVGVWEAVLEGMDEPARLLFEHYNRGLPDADSSAELWLRMQGYMNWLEKIASEN